MKHTKEQLALANEFLKRCNIGGICHALEGGTMELNSVLCDFLDYAGGLTFVKTAYTEQTGGGIMNDNLLLNDGKRLVICDDAICLYEKPEDYDNGITPPKTIYRHDEEELTKKFVEEWNKNNGTIIYKEKKKHYLLFGKEVCETIMEETIGEVCRLIEDGASYSVMETDGSNLAAILSELEGMEGYAFITEEQYKMILDI